MSDLNRQWPRRRIDECQAGDVVYIDGLGTKTISGFSEQAWMSCPRVHFEEGGHAVARADTLWHVRPRTES